MRCSIPGHPDPYFLHPRKAAQRLVFQQIPRDRLLVETDAPDMWPPDEFNADPLQDDYGRPLNHPRNIETALRALAENLSEDPAAFSDQIAKNFGRLFIDRPDR